MVRDPRFEVRGPWSTPPSTAFIRCSTAFTPLTAGLTGAPIGPDEACIAAGVHGLATGGLASDCRRLTAAEKRQTIAWLAEDCAGRVPFSVTLSEPTAAKQITMAEVAAAHGAGWLVLQPPPLAQASDEDLIAFFGAIADAVTLPVGIQNAPEYIGIGLSDDGLVDLHRRHPNVTIVKAEGDAIACGRLVRATDGAMTLFNGRNGIELIDSLAAGFDGLIPSPCAADVQARIYDHFRTGEREAAMAMFRDILPLLSFLMISVDHLLCYGKRLTARRLGLDTVHGRSDVITPDAFGLEVMARWSSKLGPLGAAPARKEIFMATFVLVHGAWHGGWCWGASPNCCAPRAMMCTHRRSPGWGIARI